MPIGLTASGEIVFPIQCKDFIERQKAIDPKAAERGGLDQKAVDSNGANQRIDEKPEEGKAAIPEDKPALPNASAPPSSVGELTADQPEPISKARHIDHSTHAIGPSECKHYRTYDSKSGTYRGYDGKVRSCP